MLETMGLDRVDQLFSSIPEGLRLKAPLDLPEALDEQRLFEHVGKLASMNRIEQMQASFLGAGVYEHFVPAVVGQILARGEFLTSYTPYQPEVSQGTLKAIFEFQTMLSEILGMDLANASMYDGAHATAEALLMGLRIRRKATKVLVSSALNPEYKEVSKTYLSHLEGAYVELPEKDGLTDLSQLDASALDGVAMVMVQCPNFYGSIEDLEAIKTFCTAHDLLFGVCFSEPLAYGLVKAPGAVGADIAAGEAQSLGLAPGFGGPLLGVLACKIEHVRMTPGRLVSQGLDTEGRESYVLTLATREQHIRRARATSNICTNQGLMALACTIYLSLVGKQGFRELAELNLARAEYAKAQLCAIPDVTLVYDAPTFNEFVIRTPKPAAEVVRFAAARGVAAGLNLGRVDAAHHNDLLLAVTEINSREQIDLLVQLIGEMLLL